MIAARRLLAAVLSLLAALGAAATGGAACNEPCALPTARIEVKLPDALEPGCAAGAMGVFEGAVHRDGKALVLTTGKEVLSFPDLDAAIPDGTFVRLFVACRHVPLREPGRFLAITNLPSLGIVPNPTESGERLWYMVANGETVFVLDFPATFALEQACEVGNDQEGYLASESFVLDGGDQVVIVAPGETREFTTVKGEQAGTYSFENVNITYAGDSPVALNFRIRRAD